MNGARVPHVPPAFYTLFLLQSLQTVTHILNYYNKSSFTYFGTTIQKRGFCSFMGARLYSSMAGMVRHSFNVSWFISHAL